MAYIRAIKVFTAIVSAIAVINAEAIMRELRADFGKAVNLILSNARV